MLRIGLHYLASILRCYDAFQDKTKGSAYVMHSRLSGMVHYDSLHYCSAWGYDVCCSV